MDKMTKKLLIQTLKEKEIALSKSIVPLERTRLKVQIEELKNKIATLSNASEKQR